MAEKTLKKVNLGKGRINRKVVFQSSYIQSSTIMPKSKEVRGEVSNSEEQIIKKRKFFTDIENVTSKSSIEDIPVEVLIQIFESLCMKDIENCSNTCVEWRRICLIFIFRPYLKKFAMEHKIQDTLIANGWTDSCEDLKIIRNLYEMLKSYKGKSLLKSLFKKIKYINNLL